MKRLYFQEKPWGQNYLSRGSRYFLLFFLSGLLSSIIFGACSDWSLFDKSVPKEETRSKVDITAIKQAQSKAVEAFNASNQDAVDALCFDEAKSTYANQYSKEELTIIGSYLEKAKLTSVSSIHAEYTYKIDKVEYTFTMGIDGEGNWKIVRY